MASEYDTDSKRVEFGVDVGREASGTGYLRIPGFKNHSPKRANPLFRLVLDEDKPAVVGHDERLQALLRAAVGGNEIQCHCLALGYTKEQCKAKECKCAWCAPLATWFFCEELVIQEEPG
jgi:hypothetical protein